MRDEFVMACFPEGRQGEQTGVIAELAGELSFRNGLLSPSAEAADEQSAAATRRITGRDRLRSQGEHRLAQSVLRFANGELGRVHPHRDASRPGGMIVTGQRALGTLVELAFAGEGERVSWDDGSISERGSNPIRCLRKASHDQ